MPKIAERSYIETDTVLAVFKAAGLRVIKQAAYLQAKGPEGKRLYIRKGKNVGRLDFSGFTMPEGTPGVVNLDGKDGRREAFGRVLQEVDFDRPSEQVLKAIVAVAKTCAKVTKAKGKKARPATKPISTEVQATA